MTPDGWTRAKLVEITRFVGRGTAPKYATEPTPVVAISQKCVRNGRITVTLGRYHEADQPVKADSLLRAGDICLNSTGTGTIGRAGLWTGVADGQTYFADTHVTVLRPEPSRLVPKLLLEVLLAPSIQRRLESECFSGSTNQVELNKSALVELEILVPPLPEQRRIAAILTSVDDAIETTQMVIDQVQVASKAITTELLTRGLPGRHTRFKRTEIGELPEEWGIVPLERIATVDTGFAFKSADFCTAGDRSHPIVRMSDLKSGILDLSSSAHVPASVVETLARFAISPGDLLVGLSGSLANYAIVPPNLSRPTYLNQRVGRIRTAPGSQHFMYCWYTSAPVQTRVMDLAAGGAQPNVSPLQIRKLLVPRPSADEEHEIGKMASALTMRQHIEKATLGSLQSLKSVLTSLLVTGEVRVTPDEAVP